MSPTPTHLVSTPSRRQLVFAIAAACFAIVSFDAPERQVGAQGQADRDRADLVAGVTAIDSSQGSVPGPVLAYGQAFPVVAGAEGDLRLPVVAASRWERGRVVAFGHGGFFDAATLGRADTQSGRFMLNALRWSAGGDTAVDRLRVGVVGMDGYRAWLATQGAQADDLSGSWTANLGRYDVLVWGAWRQGQAELDAIAAYVEGGGGLVAESLAWGWMQLNPGLDIRRHAGNRLLAPAGILWADGYFDRTTAGGFAISPAPPAMTQGSDALAALETRRRQMPPAEIGQAVHTLTRAIGTLPRDDRTLLPKLRAMVAGLGPIVPTEARPIRLVEEPLERIGLTLQVEDLRFTPADRIVAHPAGFDFPGAVAADAPRIERAVAIDPRQSRWHSTGLYAAPGEHLTVEIAPGLVDDGLAVRISPFTDTLWHMESWTRVPAIASRFVLTTTTTVVASAFGGPVYVDVPDDTGNGPDPLGTFAVTVRGAVEAPLFRLGDTNVAAWRAEIRDRPAPWAEIVSGKVGITVPSEVVRDLDDPEAVMAYWDDVADAQADLAAIPRERPWAERFVADRQIGYGYMHAGYPMMTFLDVRDLVVDVGRLRREGSWGHFHELGHMHQEPEWTFEGTGEVTVNLFTLYTYDRVNDQRPGGSNAGHLERFTPAAIRKRWEAFDAAGRRFSEWKSDPFLALAMYAQLAQAFGWESYARVFAEYRRLPDAQRPRDDDARRDQWLTRMSRTVGRDLCPFFGLWGVPVSRAACDSLAGLPAWDPWTEAQATPTPTIRPSPTTTVTATPTWTTTPSPTATPMPTRAPGGRVYLPAVEAGAG